MDRRTLATVLGAAILLTGCDMDQDGIRDQFDNCAFVENADQADRDGDGVGDACDNCQDAPNPSQADRNDDGVGDVCTQDRDADDVADAVDNCPDLANADQADRDQDGVGDACDNCPDVANAGQADGNANGTGDACDLSDSDGDGIVDAEDNCPVIANADQSDGDGDGVGDLCDNCPQLSNVGQDPGDCISGNVVSRFSVDRDGWTVLGNSIDIPTHRASGGRPGGFISVADGSNDLAHWAAPDKFLGNQSAAFGRYLTFDLAQSDTNCQNINDADVWLVGGGTEVYATTAWNPDAGWTSYRVALDERAEWRTMDGELASNSTLQVVLRNLASLQIRSEFRSCGDELFALDNVVLERVDPNAPRSVNVISNFDEPEHGWTASGTAEIGATTPNWETARGRWDDGGHVWVDDTRDELAYWDAPPAYSGNMIAAYGRWLTFDLSQAKSNCQNIEAADVILRGGGLMLELYLPYNPAVGWTSYRVSLDELAGWRRADNGELASQQEMRQVLERLDQIKFRGEYRSCGEESFGLDRVVLDLGSEANPVKTGAIVSDFDRDAEGWTALGIARNAILPAWNAEGGRGGGGFVRVSDQGSDLIYWDAPAAFLGNLSMLKEGALTFNLTQELTNCQNINVADVIVRGGGYSLELELPNNPYAGWTAYRVNFDTQAGWKVTGTNALATADELARVLEHVDQILLRGEYRSCGDENLGLDQIALELGTDLPVVASDVRSDLNQAQHGWTALAAGGLGSVTPRWNSSGGVGGTGYVSVSDGSAIEALYWDAPAAFLGNVQAALDGLLVFRLRQSRTDCQNINLPNVVLRGGGRNLEFRVSNNPDAGWTTYSIRLDEFAGWNDGATGQLVTRDELTEVLAHLDQILIRGEFRSCGDEVGDLDEVVLDLNE